MKTIERLRELEKEADTRTQDMGHRMAARLRYIDAMKDALPALLAVVEAQAAEIEAWREGHDADNDDGGPALVYDLTIDPDYAIDFGKRLTAACDKTDAAIREMEGGAG